MELKRDEIRCSVCGKDCNLWMKSVEAYVYKFNTGHKYLFQCSYHCWREETRRSGRKEWKWTKKG